MSFFLPAEALEADIAILGRKGKGKTYCAKGIAETLLDLNHRVMIIDPLSVWWGLRLAADGKGKGYDVAVFGGKHGDLDLRENMARPLARVFAKENVPVIFDVKHLPRKEQCHFVAELLNELLVQNTQALSIIFEEADVFAPQKPNSNVQHLVLQQVDEVVRRGRSSGFRVITVTQRPALLNKDVLTQLSTLIALGMPGPQDRKAVKAWVEDNADTDTAKEVYESLPNLKTGEGWVWSPDFDIFKRVEFPKIQTFDTSKTPKAGETRLEPKRLDDIDLSVIREQLAALQSQKPSTKANEPSSKTSQAELEQIRKEAYDIGFDKGYKKGFTEAHQSGYVAGMNEVKEELFEDLARLTRKFKLDGTVEQSKPHTANPLPPSLPHSPTPASKPRANSQPKDLSPSASKILGVLVGSYPMGLSYAAAAARAGVSKRSSQYRQYRKEIEPYTLERSGKLVADDSVLASVAPLPQTLEAWYSSLTPSVAAMLRVIAESNTPLDKYAIAERAGVSESSSGLGAGLRELQDLGLIEKTSQGYALLEGLR